MIPEKVLTQLKHSHLLMCCFFLAVSIFSLRYMISGQAVFGDGIGYYAHLRSWVIGQDTDFTNEYQHQYSPANNNILSPESVAEVQIVGKTADGRAENPYGPGPALLLLPFFLLAHLISLSASALGFAVPTHGYADLYQWLSGVGAISYVILGLKAVDMLLVRYGFRQPVRQITTILLLFATHLLYYGTYDVLNSHSFSFFLTATFLVLAARKFSVRQQLLLGICYGLILSTRIQDGLIGMLWILHIWQQWSQEKKVSRPFLLKAITVFLITVVITCFPLLWHWQQTFGSLTNHMYVRNILSERSSGKAIDWWGSLFSEGTGLFAQSPLLLIALVFLPQLLRRNTVESKLLLLYLFSQYFVITLQGGWSAAAFGGRMYISSLPVFTILIAFFVDFLAQKWRKKSYAIFGICIIVQLGLMGRFLFFQKQTQQHGVGIEVTTQQRIQKLFPLVR